MRRLVFIAMALVGSPSFLAYMLACAKNPDIDGSKVPPIEPGPKPPSCAQVCDRIVRLCARPPDNCEIVCGNDYDDSHRSCVGVAESCRAALQECANEPIDAEADAFDASDGTVDGGEAGVPSPADATTD